MKHVDSIKKALIIVASFFLLGLDIPMDSPTKQYFEKATFAGGCFWCMESDFQEVSGVKDVISGYIGGTGKNPTYEDYGKQGHIEAIQITYDPSVITYHQLLDLFWRKIDPTDSKGQFCDRGHEYSTAIFYNTEKQKLLAEQSKSMLNKSAKFKNQITTNIIKDEGFYQAEAYHQNYYIKNPLRYKFYRFKCGRDRRLKELWGDEVIHKKLVKNISTYKKLGKEELKNKLTPLQYEVTQNDGTEPAFKNEYWDNNRKGIYVDVVSGKPLFSSIHKFQSGTGWPSFSQPLAPNNIIEKKDITWFSTRTEIRSKHADSHLGHVFNDGPAPMGLRYCINSAALRFIATKDLEKEGYDAYTKLFQKESVKLEKQGLMLKSTN